ncbi:MAG: hypothetical protein JNK04_04175 [Myxococcales bacterium]|nr:hypothetical protein [Myxococcales bacterium]
MNKLAIALLLGAVFAVGCGDKTDGAASGSAKASGAPAASGKGSAAAASTGGSSGNKVCDEYWTKLKACNEAALKAAPDAAKEATKKGFEDAEKMTKEQWSKMEGPALEAACKAMVDGLAQNPNCPK